jgi:drug/metabolite transporter (DMT)-like permease
MLLVLSLVSGETQALPVKAETWAVAAYLGTLGTLGTFLLMLYVARHWTASAASYQFVLAPVVAVALAAGVLGESVTTRFFLGGGLVLTGVAIGALSPSKARSAPAVIPAET